MKKIKCIKCGLRFNDRKDPEEEKLVHRELCMNCRHIWKVLGMILQSFGSNPFMKKPLNRDVVLRLEDVHISKTKRIR